EALGRGLLGQLGVARARDGRLALCSPTARFLDGAPPLVQLVAGGDGAADLPGGNLRVDGGAEPLRAIGERLAAQFGYDVALVRVDGVTPRRALKSRLVEARLHGAWPVIEVHADPLDWLDALDEGPSVVVVRGDVPDALSRLPAL
ncbi:MAG: hypothetical protein JWN44_1527, partial [Myxococcales bacterium]|nr:hypothetical protein [Myxococcales bacterium]